MFSRHVKYRVYLSRVARKPVFRVSDRKATEDGHMLKISDIEVEGFYYI